MNGVRAWAAAILLAVACLPFSGCATVKSVDELSAMQIAALQESDQRLDVYDRQLQKLDDDYARGHVRRAYYQRISRDLTTLIAEESQFQNAILIKDPKIKVMAEQLLANIQKALEMTPVIATEIGMVVLESFAHATITP